MTKVKYIIICILFTMMLFVANDVQAADTITATEKTKTSTGVEIIWTYTLNDNDEIEDLACSNKSSISGSVVIPSTLDGKKVVSLLGGEYPSVEDYAFNNCVGLTEVTIPDTITQLKGGEFYGCTGLQKVTMSDNVTSIGYETFKKCIGLQSITIPSELTSIGKGAFEGCTGIKELNLPSSLISIGNMAFEGCTGIKELIIPNSVTTIDYRAFRECTGIKSLTLSNKLTTISQMAFEGCSGLESVIIPESVTTIDGEDGYDNIYGAFESCTNLKKILIPDSVATIRKSAFYDCSNLTIYGNEGSVAQTYAKENDIPFELIANWDKDGSDITAPTVKEISIDNISTIAEYNSLTSDYRITAGKQIKFVVAFSEEITGKTAPTLGIKIGTGNEILLTEGEIAGNKIVYLYTTTNNDNGIIKTSSLKGGDITDIAGNSAELSCPSLSNSIDIFVGSTTNENNTSTKTESTVTSNTETAKTENITEKNNQLEIIDNNNQTTTNAQKTQSTDTTKAKESTLPHTGVGISLVGIIVAMIAIGIIAYRKFNYLRDI